MNLLSHYKNLPAKYFYHCAFLTVSIFLNHVNEISKYILVKKNEQIVFFENIYSKKYP